MTPGPTDPPRRILYVVNEDWAFLLNRLPMARLSPLATISAALAIRKLESRICPSIVHHSGVQCCVFGSLAALGRDFATVNAITGLGYIFTSVSFRSRLLKLAMTWLLPRLLNRRQKSVLRAAFCSTRASARWSRPMISCVRRGTISI